jgi:hypothetical protein
LGAVVIFESLNVDVARNDPKAWVASSDGPAEGLLAGHDEARRRKQSDFAFRKRFFEQRDRDGIDAPPRVSLQEPPELQAEVSRFHHGAKE